ncbi:MAG: RHS repeat-associated core domain-containing protein, partial [Flavobacterium sp.]|nr:RHS repeat-associated core domain-containing protein [Flavobacterium sp.]
GRYAPPSLQENTIFGSGRIGVFKRTPGKYQQGYALYEITDHLGNVRAVIQKTDQGILALTNKTDYYPFGMPMPNKTTTDGLYRYAFQGQEKDPETGMEAFELRLWDGRIGRWLTVDPKGQFFSPYLGMGNDPINATDPDGGWIKYTVTRDKSGLIKVKVTVGGKILNLSNKSYAEVWSGVSNQMARLHRIYGNKNFESTDSNGVKTRVQMTIDFQYSYARNLSEVSKNDHIIAIVNKGRYTNQGGGRHASNATLGGQFAAISADQIWAIPHELGHNLGLDDLYDKKNYQGTKDNLMFNGNSNNLLNTQLFDIFANMWGDIGKTMTVPNFNGNRENLQSFLKGNEYENPDSFKFKD